MTAEKDQIAEVVLRTLRSRVEEYPRIEAVAKLLFTGPIYQHGPDDWEVDETWFSIDKRQCLMAAEDVLRGIDEATAWEYGVQALGDHLDGMVFNDLETAQHESNSYSTGEVMRRRAPGPWEPLASSASRSAFSAVPRDRLYDRGHALDVDHSPDPPVADG